MGTRFELILADQGDAPWLRSVGELALEEIRWCHERFNRFSPSSLVTHLRRASLGTRIRVDRDTFALIRSAHEVCHASDGAFDPSGGWGMGDLDLDEHHSTITPHRSGIALDLGGIAKGFALDRAADVLRDHAVESAFLHGGTSSALGIGTPPGGVGWGVSLSESRNGSKVFLQDQALSVSAAWDDNPNPTRDPRTKTVIPSPRRVAVVGPTATLADAWSTAALVLGTRPTSLGPEWSVSFA